MLVGSAERTTNLYNASDDVGYNVAHLPTKFVASHPGILIADGIQIDIISTVGGRCVNGNIPSGWTAMGGWGNTNMTCPGAFWRTLVADRSPDGGNPPSWYRRACEEVFRRNGMGDLDTSKMIAASVSDDRDFLLRVQSVTWGKRFFMVGSSKPGIGSAICKTGDIVVVLYGCSVPVLLRTSEVEGYHELIGDCYVHGFMDGEGVRIRRAGGSTGKIFKIR